MAKAKKKVAKKRATLKKKTAPKKKVNAKKPCTQREADTLRMARIEKKLDETLKWQRLGVDRLLESIEKAGNSLSSSTWEYRQENRAMLGRLNDFIGSDLDRLIDKRTMDNMYVQLQRNQQKIQDKQLEIADALKALLASDIAANGQDKSGQMMQRVVEWLTRP